MAVETITRSRTQPSIEAFELTEREIDLRKRFLEFDDDDVSRLESMYDLTLEYVDQVIDGFYRHLLSFEETAVFFRDPKVLEHVRRKQREYFVRLTQGDYEKEYVDDRLQLGAVHERIGLPVRSFLGMYAFYLRAIAARLLDAYRTEPERAFEAFHSLMKLLFLDIGLAVDTYIFQREQTIASQQEAIRELSTPVLRVRDRLLVLPVIGVLDTYRARQLTEGLLSAIRASRAKVVILDVTGVPSVDSAVANHLLQTVEAARLMGARAIVTGLSADVAQTLVTLGVDLTKMNAVGDLQGGIEEADRITGYRVVYEGSEQAANGSSDSQAG
ncbi:MAG TPA: protoglobin domain-containing protein [Gaiellales bacterium]|jgi:rsbT co-antagonist protein RsbR|nr:protoglobin domain-containing protein [Gaiellales bacterium]